MKKTIYRLEQALSRWEDFIFGLSVTYNVLVSRGQLPASGLRGVLVNYHKLRKSMLNVFSADYEKMTDEYVFPHEAYELSSDMSGIYFPAAILGWSRHSRRVFSISHDLQALLDATSLEEVTWGDIQFPFESFAVVLGKPLIDSQGTQFDCVLVCSMITEHNGEEAKNVVFLPFDSMLENRRPISEQEKKHILTLLNNGKMRKVARALPGLLEGPHGSITTSCVVLRGNYLKNSILDSEKIAKADISNVGHAEEAVSSGNLYGSIFRIMAGMCLYLKTLPAKSPHVSDWEKTEPLQTQRGGSITNRAEVCTVESQFRLSTEEREAFGGKEGEPVKSFGEKCCHFRRGTWCRPPGHGDDPTYPRTIWRRPTLVRADKLIPGELPRGAETILLK